MDKVHRVHNDDDRKGVVDNRVEKEIEKVPLTVARWWERGVILSHECQSRNSHSFRRTCSCQSIEGNRKMMLE